MRSRLLLGLVTFAILLAVGGASVYAGGLLLNTNSSAMPPQAAQAPTASLPEASSAGDAPRMQGQFDTGLLVTGVLPGSPALQAGIHRGCIIVAADGQAVNLPEQLERVVGTHKIGDSVLLSLMYCSALTEARVPLARAPAPPDEQPPAVERPWLGIIVAPPVQADRLVPNSEGGPAGAVSIPLPPVFFFNESGAAAGIGIIGITPGSPAAQGGLQPGDVIVGIDGKEDRAPRALFQRLAAARPGDSLELTVSRAGQTLTLHITLGAQPGSPEKVYLGVYAWSIVGG